MSPENGNLLSVSSQLATVVCQAIATTQRQDPRFLTANLRHHDWQDRQHQARFIHKLAEALAEQPVPQQAQKAQQFLSRFFDPAFFVTPEFHQLRTTLERLETASALLEPVALEPVVLEPMPVLTMQTVQSVQLAKSRQALAPACALEPVGEVPNALNHSEGAIALLLLDAENLQLDTRQETFLTHLCAHPLRVKIAFANWKTLGKYDQELHQRGYDLMHVPTGNDIADGKMIAIGSSIRAHYPAVREVLVCSSDNVMTSLCTKLRQQGLGVYQVRKQADGALSVLNSDTGQTGHCPKQDMPSIEACLDRIKDILWTTQQKQGSAWVKLSTVSKQFQEQSGFLISQVVTHYMPEKRARDLFLDHPDAFGIHQPSEQSELYISLFGPRPTPPATAPKATETPPVKAAPKDMPLGPAAATKAASPSVNATESASRMLPFKDAKQLEAAIATLVKALTAQDPTCFVNIGKVSSQFNQRYQRPITEVLKQLNIAKKYPAFLQSCSSLVVQQIEKSWQVKLR